MTLNISICSVFKGPESEICLGCFLDTISLSEMDVMCLILDSPGSKGLRKQYVSDFLEAFFENLAKIHQYFTFA